jgi:hypothetical protein
MRLVKTGATALAVVSASVIGAGIAQADVTLEVSAADAAELLNCAHEAGVESELYLSPGGGTITISDSVNGVPVVIAENPTKFGMCPGIGG